MQQNRDKSKLGGVADCSLQYCLHFVCLMELPEEAMIHAANDHPKCGGYAVLFCCVWLTITSMIWLQFLTYIQHRSDNFLQYPAMGICSTAYYHCGGCCASFEKARVRERVAPSPATNDKTHV